MKPAIIKSKDELPLFLTVMDMAALLGISRSSAYELAAEEGFPKLKLVPGRVIISRDKLFEWLDEQTSYMAGGGEVKKVVVYKLSFKGIHQNRGRRAQIRGFPISKQDKGVFHYTPITATGNAVREL